MEVAHADTAGEGEGGDRSDEQEGVTMAIAGKGTDQRTVVVLMVFTTGIALVGHTLAKPKTTKIALPPEIGDAQILIGGTVATVILTLISEAGDTAAKFSKGLAFIALLAVLANYGGPVATGLNRLSGATAPPTVSATKPVTKVTTKKGTP
jgi:hypothetical protein